MVYGSNNPKHDGSDYELQKAHVAYSHNFHEKHGAHLTRKNTGHFGSVPADKLELPASDEPRASAVVGNLDTDRLLREKCGRLAAEVVDCNTGQIRVSHGVAEERRCCCGRDQRAAVGCCTGRVGYGAAEERRCRRDHAVGAYVAAVGIRLRHGGCGESDRTGIPFDRKKFCGSNFPVGDYLIV